MTPEQHSLLAQLAQLGLQKLTEDAQAALMDCTPVVEAEPQDCAEPPPEDTPE